jgi:hypothetical protein
LGGCSGGSFEGPDPFDLFDLLAPFERVLADCDVLEDEEVFVVEFTGVFEERVLR